ncbi:MAG: hypothetical protein H6745_12670 [Deltaproteobacteria bacterium]|nr:hypothetical protein [Deltaproteobacteria bacterium]
MQHCPSPTCPYRVRKGVASECADTATACPDCGGALAPGEAPAAVTAGDDAPAHVPRSLRLRLVVTAIGVALIVALGYVSLLDVGDLPAEVVGAFRFAGSPFSLIAVGVTPFLTAYALVELVAVAVPGLRARRVGGREARAPLRLAADLLGLALALLAAYGFAVGVQYVSSYGGPPLGLFPTMLLGFGGAVALRLLWWILDAGALTGGVALLLFTGAVLELLDVTSDALTRANLEGTTPVAALAPMLVVGAVMVVMLALPAALRRGLGLTASPISLPTSGVSPMADLLVFVALADRIAWLAGYGFDAPSLLDPVAGDLGFIVVLAVLVLGEGWLFQRPRRVARLARGLGHPGSDLRATRRAFVIGSALTLVALSLSGLLVSHVVAIATVIAVALDLAASWRFRRVHGALVPVRDLHRVYAVTPALAALERAGVPAHADGRCFRALFPFFASYAPVVVLVRPEDEDAARACLHRGLHAGDPVAADVAGAFD